MTLRIGTRGSPLALWQARHVAALLRDRAGIDEVHLVEIETIGDQVRDRPLSQIGGDGVFTKAIQDALLDDRADIAVHSLKDLPTTPVDSLVLGAVPERGLLGDAFLSARWERFEDLPAGATVATSSLRRKAQLRHRRPDLRTVDIRGNVETRLKKLATDELDGLVLAEAGLHRLGLASHIRHRLDPSWMLPAVGQGALGLECRRDDEATRAILAHLDHPSSHAAVLAERAFLRGLGGGCLVPIGAEGTLQGEVLHLRGAILAPDGSVRLSGHHAGPASRAEQVGQELAVRLLDLGAEKILATR